MAQNCQDRRTAAFLAFVFSFCDWAEVISLTLPNGTFSKLPEKLKVMRRTALCRARNKRFSELEGALETTCIQDPLRG